MFISTSRNSNVLRITIAAASIAALAISPIGLAQEHQHGKDAAAAKELTGEVVDMMCYLDHNAMGEKHGQSCGVTCIKGGGPVGIVSDGKAYLVVGEHKPINDELAPFCG
jgi:hypothetical protein